MVDPVTAGIFSSASRSVAMKLMQLLDEAFTNNPTDIAQNFCIEETRTQLKELVKETKAVFDKGEGLNLELLKDLAGTLAKAEVYGDAINYIFKRNLYCDLEKMQIELDKLLDKLKGLKNNLSENQSIGHEQEGEIPPGSVRRCLLYLSCFPKGFVYNCKRITRLLVALEFIAANSSEPPLQQYANWLKPVESSWDGEIAPCYILIGNNVEEQTEKWAQRLYFRETVLESTESIKEKICIPSPSLVVFGGRNHTFKLEKRKFNLLRVLSLRNVRLENEINLKELSFLKHLDLKYTDVRDCSWLKYLEELEMLDLRYTRVEEIPQKCLEKLEKLQHLLLGYYPNENANRLAGVKLNTTKEMVKMKTLRTIRWFDQLGSFSKVADLFVTGLKKGELKSFWVTVEKFENLTSLGVAVTKDSDITLQDCPAKLKDKLKRLRMEGKFSIGSNSAQPHSGLAELCNFKELIDLTLASHKPINIDSIPKLSKLFCLRLYSFCREKTLILRVQGFESLKKLVIGDMAKVETVQIASDVIEKIDTLKLRNLRKFRQLICLESNSKPHLLRRKESETVPFKEIQKTKTIFLRGDESFANIDFEKSPGLKIYHYDMNKQCYQVVSE